MTVAGKFARGFAVPLKGALILANHRKLQKYAFAPFAVTTVIFITGLAAGLPVITQAVTPVAHAVTRNPAGQMLLAIALWPALALALTYVLVNLARLACGPLYGLLAEKTLVNQGALEKSDETVAKWFARQVRLTRAGLVKTAIFLVAGIMLGLLSFIPGLGFATSFVFLVLLAYDIVDYALDALGLKLERRIDFFRQHFAVFIGLGIALGLVFLIPGLNFFALPASVVGASDLTRRLAAND